MARIITKELAIEIAKKLGAVPCRKKGRAHDLYVVSHKGRFVTSFGIRHGSAKDQGHDFIPGAIYLSPRDAKLFGQCAHSYEFWVEKMKEKGVIPAEPDQPQ